MKLLAIISFMTLLIMPCIAYQNHGIFFDIPKNWQLVSDQWNNSTQSDGTLLTDAKIELTDNQSTIRIDVVNSPRIAGFIDATGWEPMSGKPPNSLDRFYEDAVLNRLRNGTNGRGTPYKDYSFWFYYNESDECKAVDLEKYFKECNWNPVCKEIVLVKPLSNQMIGIYGNFNGTYEAQEIGMMKYPMLQPIYDIANSLKPI